MTNDELREWMRAHRYSIRVLASALDVNPSTVQRYRDGTLSIPRVVELALKSLAHATPWERSAWQ